MQFTITRENLLSALQMIMGAIENRQSMPILSNAFLSVTNDTLTLVGTDLEVELHGVVKVDSVIEQGKITVPARKLLDICRALPDQSILSLVLERETLIISCGKSRFKLATLPAEEYPNVEERVSIQEISISQSLLRKLIEKVSFSMAQQDIRYYLNGVFFVKTATYLKMISMDGHRLSLCCHAGDFGGDNTSSIVPKKAVTELLRLLSDDESEVTINLGSNHLTVLGHDYTFISKLVEGKYPEYQKIIPQNVSNQILLDRDVLKNTLTRVAILSNEKHHGVTFYLEPGKLVVEARNSEREESYEELSIDYDQESLEVGFNVVYLIDVLNVLPVGNVRIGFSDSKSGIQIESENNNEALYVIMPLRI